MLPPGIPVFVLFYLGDVDRGFKFAANPDYAPSESHEAGDCDFCNEGSVPVRVSNDSLFPIGEKVREVEINANCLKRSHRRALEELCGRGVFRVHAVNELGGNSNVYVDFKEVVSGKLPARLERFLAKELPQRLEMVVACSDEASQLLAEKIIGRYATKIPRVSIEDVMASGMGPCVDGVVLVVSTCVGFGSDLIGASRALRESGDETCIRFLVLLARTSSESELRAIRDNLTFGSPAQARSVSIAYELPIPPRSDRSPWAAEIELWKGVDATTLSPSSKSLIGQRQSILRDLSSPDRHSHDELFLPDSQGERLSIRDGYVFLRGADFALIRQSDVYASMVAALHSMRIRKRDPLRQTVHSRAVLSPSCFARYHDGVIQASILRAARVAELDYRSCDTSAGKMVDQLRLTLVNWRSQQGEAALEFLLCLAIRKMKLPKRFRNPLLQAMRDAEFEGLGAVLCSKVESVFAEEA